MLEFLIEFKDQFLAFLIELKKGFTIFLPTITIVYIVGKALDLAHTDVVKNSIAILFAFIISFLQHLYINNILDLTLLTYRDFYEIFYYGCIGILLYILIGFKLYPRVDAWLDKHFAKDKAPKERIKKRKKK